MAFAGAVDFAAPFVAVVLASSWHTGIVAAVAFAAPFVGQKVGAAGVVAGHFVVVVFAAFAASVSAVHDREAFAD